LIKLLKDLTAVYGESSPDQPNTYVNHSLTQQEMASLIATSRKSISLMMNELEREGKLKQANFGSLTIQF
jgi:CRP/FNR family transcriptional regulator, cyclic AMP receptor protein